jgi:hypothetical protein
MRRDVAADMEAERRLQRAAFVRAYVLARAGDATGAALGHMDWIAQAYAAWDEIEKRETVLRGEFVPRAGGRDRPEDDFPADGDDAGEDRSGGRQPWRDWKPEG